MPINVLKDVDPRRLAQIIDETDLSLDELCNLQPENKNYPIDPNKPY